MRCLLGVVLCAVAFPSSAESSGRFTSGSSGSAPVASRAAAAPVATWRAAGLRALRVSHMSSSGLPKPHEFFFTRGVYSGGVDGEEWGARWAVDYPKADHQFLIALRRLSIVDAYELDNAISLDDPALRRFPFVYILEVGSMALSESEVEGLRSFLLAGGFLVVDDFWGSWAWETFESEMRRVFPDRPIVEIPMDHPVFHAFYDVTEILQVPNVYQATFASAGGPTHEYDGYVPHVRGIFDDDGRLMVLINWNTDLGDAWEWADDPNYPLKYSTFAYEMGINFVIYGMSH